jgi:hypothetical protein
MKTVKAFGICLTCGKRSKAIGHDEQDAELLLNHNHGSDFGHCFEGDVVFKAVELNLDAQANSSQKKRRKR